MFIHSFPIKQLIATRLKRGAALIISSTAAPARRRIAIEGRHAHHPACLMNRGVGGRIAEIKIFESSPGL
jgi:hypothetical protein